MEPTRINVGSTLRALSQKQNSSATTKASSSTVAPSERTIRPWGLLQHYQHWILTDYPKDLTRPLEPFWAGKEWAVTIIGVLGCGKTCLAAAILKHALAIGKAGNGGCYTKFVEMNLLADAVRDWEYGPGRLKEWTTNSFLVLDDIGAARSTPAVVETLVRIITYRYSRELPTVVTSNLSLADMAEAVDGRIPSRLAEGVVIQPNPVDLRLRKSPTI